MKAYQLTVRVIDHDEIGPDDIKTVIENARYPNHCIHPEVAAISSRDIGEWTDDHPLNSRVKAEAEWERLFGSEVAR